MDNIPEGKTKVSVSWFLLAYGVIGIVVATYTITSVYWNFKSVETDLKKMTEQIEYIDQRHDRKEERLKATISELEQRLEALEVPGSDKKK